MIISASYKTDIPAFYGRWFANRLRAGYCKMVNPYSRRIMRVSLTRPFVDGFVFWTKNLGPFMPVLRQVHGAYPFVIQYSITGYPRELETAVVSAQRSIDNCKAVAAQYGTHVTVWRYDTILFSSLTPPDFHRSNFARLASALSGASDEVVVSFAQMYRKTQRNLNVAARARHFSWREPPFDEKAALLRELSQCAAAYNLRLSVCSQPEFVMPGVEEARCIDAKRLSGLSGQNIRALQRGNRAGCACYQSRDIGEYDTCPHGCVYCYAVQDRRTARARFSAHDPESEFLFPPPRGARDCYAADPFQILMFE